MTRPFDFADKRQFGRRTVLWHGWIKVAGRDREPCIVRNFSVSGALLEFTGAPPASNRFHLCVDAFNFTADCSVRHRSATGIGVYFVEPQDGIYQPGQVTPQQVVDSIRGTVPRNRH